MKYRFYSFIVLAFMIIASSVITVKAETDTTEQAAITVTSNNKKTVKTATAKTIKVNKSAKLKKVLKVKKSTFNKLYFKVSNPKVAKISDKGAVTGLKKGKTVITATNRLDNSVYAKITVKVKNRYSKSQLRLLSSLIYSEAGSECYAGKVAVGIVVMNRVKSSKFPNSIKSVIYQRGQFTPAINGSLNRSLSLYDSGRLDSDCITAAKTALNGTKTVIYGGTQYNMKNYLFFSGYVRGCKLVIQNHQFK